MKLPKSLTEVDVLGKSYQILPTTTEDKELGACEPNKCLIEYRPEQHIQQLRDSLWHEVLHACYSEMGIGEEIPEELEETIVLRMATSTLYVQRYNPELMKFLQRKDR